MEAPVGDGATASSCSEEGSDEEASEDGRERKEIREDEGDLDTVVIHISKL